MSERGAEPLCIINQRSPKEKNKDLELFKELEQQQFKSERIHYYPLYLIVITNVLLLEPQIKSNKRNKSSC